MTVTPQRQTTVVVCDDAPQLRTLLRYAFEDEPDLRLAGEAADGADAIALIADVRPDVVLLDLSMPQMDGLEAIPEIRRVSPGSAIIVFSGFTADGPSDEALALGVDRYLEKGTDIDAVAVAVREVVKERAMAPIARRISSVSPRVVLVVRDDRVDSGADTDDLEISFEVDGQLMVSAAFDLQVAAVLRDELTELIERQLPPPTTR